MNAQIDMNNIPFICTNVVVTTTFEGLNPPQVDELIEAENGCGVMVYYIVNEVIHFDTDGVYHLDVSFVDSIYGKAYMDAREAEGTVQVCKE